MNTARRCTNQNIFRTLPMSSNGGSKVDRPAAGILDATVRLLHLHYSCVLNAGGVHASGGKGGLVVAAPEMVIYQVEYFRYPSLSLSGCQPTPCICISLGCDSRC